MIRDITLGQFFPGKSPLHNADPRVKLFLTVFYIVTLFLAKNIFAFALVTLFSVFLIIISGISPKIIFKGLKPLIIIIVLTTVINIFYVSGTPIFPPFELFGATVTVTWEGLATSAVLVLRITLLIVTTSLLTYTTAPIALTDGIESLLAPLNLIRLPIHEFAMMMTIALRFIPTLIDETGKIISAQKSRGSSFDEGGLIKRAKSLIPVLVPLFVSAFKRADDLATAMECRCYTGGKGRTKLKQYKMRPADYLSIAVFVLVTAGVVTINILLGDFIFAI